MALEFNEERHEYKWDGVIVPSVSNIIAPLRDFSGIPPQVLETKKQWGIAVHLYTSMFDKGELDPDRSKWDERMITVVDAWKRFKGQFNLESSEFDCIETKMYHRVFRYSGTTDRIFSKSRTIVDIKTAAQPQPASGVQLSAYASLAANDWDGDCQKPEDFKLIEVCLLDDGSFKIKQYEFAPNWNIFMCCLSIYNFKHGGK